MKLYVNKNIHRYFWLFCLYIFCAIVFLFLLAPIFIIIPISFSASNFFIFPPSEFSLKWYHAILTDPVWRTAATNSIFISFFATIIAVSLGTAASVGLAISRSRLRGLLMGLFISPITVPIVIVGAAIFFFDVAVGLVGTYMGIIMAQAALGLPFVVVTVSATLSGLDFSLLKAGASLGASPARVFTSITLPLIFPGVAAGALFAFAFSFDEIVVTLFLAAPGQRTLPIQIFSGIQRSISPSITAVATLLILFTALLIVATVLLRRRSKNYSAPVS